MGDRYRLTEDKRDPLDSTTWVVVDLRDLGVIIDSQLCMDEHVAALCRGGYYQLWQLRPIIRSLSKEAAETLVHAFVSSRLDYCNALLCRRRAVPSPTVRPERRGATCIRGYGAVITSGRPYYVSTGCLCDSEYCSRSLSWSTSVWTAWHRRTWQITANLSPTSVRVNSVRLTLWPAPSDVHGPPTATGVLPLLAHECGTLCQPN